MRQLTRKFGELSSDVEAKIRSADGETLLSWADRVLDAQTLDEVFVDS